MGNKLSRLAPDSPNRSQKRQISYNEAEANACRVYEYKPVRGQPSQSSRIARQQSEPNWWRRSSSPTWSDEYCFVLTPSPRGSVVAPRSQCDCDECTCNGTGLTSAELVQRWHAIQDDWELWPGNYYDHSRQRVVVSRPPHYDHGLDKYEYRIHEERFEDTTGFINVSNWRRSVALPPQPSSRIIVDPEPENTARRRDSRIPQELQKCFLGAGGAGVRRIATMTPAGMKYLPLRTSDEQSDDLPPLKSSRVRVKINRVNSMQ
jgi:hypothetical protein